MNHCFINVNEIPRYFRRVIKIFVELLYTCEYFLEPLIYKIFVEESIIRN